LAQGSVNSRLKTAHHNADGVPDPPASQFLTGQRGFFGCFGIFSI
jgi:hypothetical protein